MEFFISDGEIKVLGMGALAKVGYFFLCKAPATVIISLTAQYNLFLKDVFYLKSRITAKKRERQRERERKNLSSTGSLPK